MSEPLAAGNIVRGSAQGGEDTDTKFSALGREVVGLFQNDTYQVGGTDDKGRQVFTPTADSRRAQMETLKTPQGVPRDQLRQQLGSKGVDTSNF